MSKISGLWGGAGKDLVKADLKWLQGLARRARLPFGWSVIWDRGYYSWDRGYYLESESGDRVFIDSRASASNLFRAIDGIKESDHE